MDIKQRERIEQSILADIEQEASKVRAMTQMPSSASPPSK
jgi:hypothetical protein